MVLPPDQCFRQGAACIPNSWVPLTLLKPADVLHASGECSKCCARAEGRIDLSDGTLMCSSPSMCIQGNTARAQIAFTDVQLAGADVSLMSAEGRIEPSDGTLMCSYHGWRFQGDGKCTTVPQALDSKANTAACSSARSCASTRPTQVSPPHA